MPINAFLNNEKNPQIFHLITLIYQGGAKVSFFAKEFEVKRSENGEIVWYNHDGVDFDTHFKLSIRCNCPELVFAPLGLGNPKSIIAAFTTPYHFYENEV